MTNKVSIYPRHFNQMVKNGNIHSIFLINCDISNEKDMLYSNLNKVEEENKKLKSFIKTYAPLLDVDDEEDEENVREIIELANK